MHSFTASMHLPRQQRRQQQQAVPPALRVYQIVAPALAGRAALFGNKLDLKAGWRALDEPFFSAPGVWCGAAVWWRQLVHGFSGQVAFLVQSFGCLAYCSGCCSSC